MADPRVERLADVIVSYSTAVRAGDLVVVDATPLAAPLVRETYGRVLRAGGHPHVRVAVDGIEEALFREGSEEQLQWVSPAREQDVERADVRIVFEAEYNTRSMTQVDPARQALAGRARKRLGDRLFARTAAGEMRWCVTVYPTNAAAQEAGMSLAQYEDFVFGAGLLDREDPVAEWRALADRIGGLAGWLGGKDELRVVADGTDLRIGVGGRTWVASGGKENFPDGEVFTGPVETRVDGEISFTYPAAFRGRVVEGLALRFQDGEVVDASATRGQAFLEEMLAMDAGSRRAGEFAFGLNEALTEFTANTLFDEKIGGTVHLALGKSYPETGGRNESALHWDLVCDLRQGSEVYADGELVYENGRFLNGVAG
ncbi:MAG: aminopeptidase [Thermoleophilia bacterium]|nr:aminopeptidase [Thermoleophilia bacterium]